MTPEAMTQAQWAIHRDGPMRARYVVEAEILETEHGTLAEVEVRAHTWAERHIYVDGPTLADALAKVDEAISAAIAAHGEPE
jgi:hypothetical protein